MKRLFLAIAIGLLAAPAFAQDKNALAIQYVKMPEIQNMMTEMFSPSAMGNQIAASLPASVGLSEDQKQRIGVLMSEAMNELRPKLEELMVSNLDDSFSIAELQALIDFYSSEHGAAVMRKMSPFMAGVMSQLHPEMQALQRKVGPEIAKILQE